MHSLEYQMLRAASLAVDKKILESINKPVVRKQVICDRFHGCPCREQCSGAKKSLVPIDRKDKYAKVCPLTKLWYIMVERVFYEGKELELPSQERN